MKSSEEGSPWKDYIRPIRRCFWICATYMRLAEGPRLVVAPLLSWPWSRLEPSTLLAKGCHVALELAEANTYRHMCVYLEAGILLPIPC